MVPRDAGDAVADPAGDGLARAFALAAEPAGSPAGSDGLAQFVQQRVAFVAGECGAVQVVIGFGVGEIGVELAQACAVGGDGGGVEHGVGAGRGRSTGHELDGVDRFACAGEEGGDVVESLGVG